MITVYGINNCDTVKRARKHLEQAGIAYHFHDFRQAGLTADMLRSWLQQIPRDRLINRRGTSWRQLSEAERQIGSDAAAVDLMLKHPTLIKRPVIDHAGTVRVGFARGDEARILDWLQQARP